MNDNIVKSVEASEKKKSTAPASVSVSASASASQRQLDSGSGEMSNKGGINNKNNRIGMIGGSHSNAPLNFLAAMSRYDVEYIEFFTGLRCVSYMYTCTHENIYI